MALGHSDITDGELRSLIRRKLVVFAGNRKMRIYGTLSCPSGKRMKRENRVFFTSENEAAGLGFRPCQNCLSMDRTKRTREIRKNQVD